MPIRLTLVALIALLGALCSAQTESLPLRDNRSSALLFLRPVALGPILKPGQARSEWQLDLSNEARFLRNPDFYEDGETWRFSYRFRQGLKNGHEWTVELPILVRGGGVMDPLLSWWHSFIGVPNPARDIQPSGESFVSVPGGTFSESVGIGDIALAYGVPSPLAHARLWLKLPTGNPSSLLGSGNLDAALSLDRRWTLNENFTFDADAGITYQGIPSRLQGTRRIVTSGNLTLTYHQNSKDSWSVHWITESSPTYFGGTPTDVTHRLMGLAYTRHYSDSSLTVYFQEDGDWGWLEFDGGATIGPDFTIGLMYRIKK